MITGTVTARHEAVIPLQVVGRDGHLESIEAILDTGVNSHLTLSPDLIRRLNLPYFGNRFTTLGDGSSVDLDLYLGIVLWHEEPREVLILQTKDGPFVGMSLLSGSRVILDVVTDGQVTIHELPHG